jgi:hypothetical protein
MFYGLQNAPSTVQTSLNSLPLNDVNFPTQAVGQKFPDASDTPSGNQNRSSRNKKGKGKKSADDSVDARDDDSELTSQCSRLGLDTNGHDSVWAALASSESDFSDAERSVPSTPTSMPRPKRCSAARIRLHSLSCFNAFIKVRCFL